MLILLRGKLIVHQVGRNPKVKNDRVSEKTSRFHLERAHPMYLNNCITRVMAAKLKRGDMLFNFCILFKIK